MSSLVDLFFGQPWYLNGYGDYLGPKELIIYHTLIWLTLLIPVLVVFGFFAIYKLNFMGFVLRFEFCLIIGIILAGICILPLVSHQKDYHFTTGVVKTYSVKSFAQDEMYVAKVYRYNSQHKLVFVKTSQSNRPLIPNEQAIN